MGCALVFGALAAMAQPFQLAQPVLLNDTPFFTDSAVIRMRFDLEGAEIRYTLDGSEPDRNSALYSGPVTIRESSMLTARAFHPDFQPSDLQTLVFIKVDTALLPVRAELSTPPSPKYPGRGAASLYDLQKGHADFSDHHWLGFQGDDLVYAFSLPSPRPARGVLVSFFVSPGSWIFPPLEITVWAKKEGAQDYEEVVEQGFPKSRTSVPEQNMIPVLPFQQTCTARDWKVVVKNYGPLPDWHPGKGQPAWLFVDEIHLIP